MTAAPTAGTAVVRGGEGVVLDRGGVSRDEDHGRDPLDHPQGTQHARRRGGALLHVHAPLQVVVGDPGHSQLADLEVPAGATHAAVTQSAPQTRGGSLGQGVQSGQHTEPLGHGEGAGRLARRGDHPTAHRGCQPHPVQRGAIGLSDEVRRVQQDRALIRDLPGCRLVPHGQPEEPREPERLDISGRLQVPAETLGAHIDAEDGLYLGQRVGDGLCRTRGHPVHQSVAVPLLPRALPQSDPRRLGQFRSQPQRIGGRGDGEQLRDGRNLQDRPAPIVRQGRSHPVPVTAGGGDEHIERHADGEQVAYQSWVALGQVCRPSRVPSQQPRQVPHLLPGRDDPRHEHAHSGHGVGWQLRNGIAQPTETVVLDRLPERPPQTSCRRESLVRQGGPRVGQPGDVVVRTALLAQRARSRPRARQVRRDVSIRGTCQQLLGHEDARARRFPVRPVQQVVDDLVGRKGEVLGRGQQVGLGEPAGAKGLRVLLLGQMGPRPPDPGGHLRCILEGHVLQSGQRVHCHSRVHRPHGTDRPGRHLDGDLGVR